MPKKAIAKPTKPTKPRKPREVEPNCTAADILTGNIPGGENPLASLLKPRGRGLHPPNGFGSFRR